MAKKKELPEIEDLISESQQVAAEFDSEIFIPDSYQSTQQDLSDRQALRRVIGLSTELSDISEAEYRQLRLERVILVGVWTEGSVKDAENSMEELAALAETAGSKVTPSWVRCLRQRVYVRTTPRHFRSGIPQVWAYRMWTVRKWVPRLRQMCSRSMDSQPMRARVWTDVVSKPQSRFWLTSPLCGAILLKLCN